LIDAGQTMRAIFRGGDIPATPKSFIALIDAHTLPVHT
jgi:hypothetical protein